MRNLKKVLALVLSLVMALSLVTVAGAAGFSKDTLESEGVSEAYLEAAQVVSGLGIYKGKDTESTGDVEFAPDDVFTREQLAGIAYRIATKDVDDSQVGLYAKYCDFEDVPEDYWAAGYIGYCQNAEIVVGYDGYFNPKGEVSGYMVLCVLLRAAGYDAYDEFKGDGWEIKVASTSKALGITDTVPGSVSLSDTVTRELACELIFRTLTEAEVVYENALWSYRTTNDNQPNVYTKVDYTMTGKEGYRDVTLGEKQFSLKLSEGEQDMWGNPYNVWYQDDNSSNTWSGSTVDTLVCELEEEPIAVYTTTVYECDVAEDCFSGKDTTATLYVNSGTPTAEKYHIVATDTTTKVGGEGRLTKVFAADNDHGVIVTMVDTFLAKVTDVQAHEDDAAGHLKTPATLVLTVYDEGTDFNTSSELYDGKPTENYVVYNGSTDWTYSVGDMVLLNAYTENNNTTINDNEKYAFTTSIVAKKNDVSSTDATAAVPETTEVNKNAKQGEGTKYDVSSVVLAESINGKQTVIYNYGDKHTVDGTDYVDALNLKLDQAGTSTGEHVWYFDTYGNIIGIADPAGSSRFGVITSLRWSDSVSDGWTTASGRAVAGITYTDGTKATEVVINSVVTVANSVTVTEGSNGGKSTTAAVQSSSLHSAPLATETVPTIVENPQATSTDPTPDPSNNVVMNLTPVFQNESNNGILMSVGTGTRTNYTNPTSAFYNADLYVSSYAPNNNSTTDVFKILTRDGQNGQLFKFVEQSDGSVQAIEVTGTKDNYTNKDIVNEDGDVTAVPHAKFAGFQNSTVSNPDEDALTATSSYIAVADNGNILVDNDTQYIIQKGTSSTLYTFTGLANMSGEKLYLTNNTEIDWADEDGDGIADYVYGVGTISGELKYSLFYFTSQTASQLSGTSFNYSTSTGTITGYLDGVLTSVDITNSTVYEAITDSASGYDTYPGHLFAVKVESGKINAAYQYSSSDYKFLSSYRKTNFIATLNLLGTSTDAFKCGDGYNSYVDSVTKAVVFDGAQLTYASGKLSWPKDTTTDTLSTLSGSVGSVTIAETKVSSFEVTGVASAVKCGSLNDLDSSYVTIVYQDSDGTGTSDTNNVALQVYITSKDITPNENGLSTDANYSSSYVTGVTYVSKGSSKVTASDVISLGTGAYLANKSGDTAGSRTFSLFLVYSVEDATNGNGVTVTITNKDGDLKWYKGFSSTAGDQMRCVEIKVTEASSNQTLHVNSFTYEITGVGTNVVSGSVGSFSVSTDGIKLA